LRQRTWPEAVNLCNQLAIAGSDDTRIPSRKEMESLMGKLGACPALPEGHPFLNVQNAFYWTEPYICPESHFYIGFVYEYNRCYFNYVWPVRGGNHNSSGDLIISELPEGQPRFTDNLDGTITDNRTGLIWIKDLNFI